MRKTSSSPSATPTRVCGAVEMSSRTTYRWKATTTADQATHAATRPTIWRTIDPRTSTR